MQLCIMGLREKKREGEKVRREMGKRRSCRGISLKQKEKKLLSAARLKDPNTDQPQLPETIGKKDATEKGICEPSVSRARRKENTVKAPEIACYGTTRKEGPSIFFKL